MKITVSRKNQLEPGEAHVTGQFPEDVPYVWIGDASGCLAIIDKRQMDALCRQWQKAKRARKKKAMK